MYKTSRNRGGGILTALKASEMIDVKARLPAEILVSILDYLPVSDQMRFARTSRRMKDMVYDDTRWVSRLKAMDCWDEAEARRRFDESIRRRKEAIQRQQQEQQRRAVAAAAANGVAPPSPALFDATEEQQKQQLQLQMQEQAVVRRRATSELRDGFETMEISGAAAAAAGSGENPEGYLDVFSRVRSVRGGARGEYGRIHGALNPFYSDLVRSRTHTEPVVFKAFRDPERQAQMLANLRRFARADWTDGYVERVSKVDSMMGVFEGAVLREFEQGYEFWDVDGRMRRYAHVLHILNGGKRGADVFIQKHPLFDDGDIAINPVHCLSRVAPDEVSLEPSRVFFETLLAKVNEQAGIVERIFATEAPAVFWSLLDRVRDDLIMEYTTPLFDEAHERSATAYVKIVSGVFEQTLLFFKSVTPPSSPLSLDAKEGSSSSSSSSNGNKSNNQKPGNIDDVVERAKVFTLQVFEPHIDLYLQEELDAFTKHAESQVDLWEKKLSEQDSSLESFYMSNINRSADKKDFLSSFKKVVMMPVTVLPSIGSPFAPKTASNGPAAAAQQQQNRLSQPATAPGLDVGRKNPLQGASAPTDELAAKAALMASKLEGIKSLFSIEVALDLVHAAKASLGRARLLMQLGGQVGGEAREQCSNMFVVLLRILGQHHVRSGFARAVDHLSHYNPREVSEHNAAGVAPLVTFIELVNVGDLISQMIDVFYEQQLTGPKIADKNDFLDPSGLAKKKFEQMLDESVAAGLNKGIDVLMDEVEYLNGTMQLPTDYNPAGTTTTAVAAAGSGTSSAATSASTSDKRASVFTNPGLDLEDTGPTPTAKRIVELVSSHTKMLVGTTDKSMLDVFNAEVGLRLFTAICKHLKRQRISTDGAVKLIADMNLYFDYVRTLRNQDLLAYFRALRELSQIYLIDAGHAKEMATVIADGDRFGGIFRAEEVYEFAQRRADWYHVRKSVERAMYGLDCLVM
ncbi:recyclin-1 [Geosmithia morbida]|uniref:Recyclin-1 n=1 Tax=Geosmithia morbida TaxID=1094350 RepID=A0A9P4YRC4_9HYPO|nr:recyclin-1 [Geosmithia morbida]KAF4120191.1 recyclin-1 [Geosmithia morbida]